MCLLVQKLSLPDCEDFVYCPNYHSDKLNMSLMKLYYVKLDFRIGKISIS